MPSTSDSRGAGTDGERPEDPVDRLERAAADRRAARERVDAVGEDELRRLRETCREFRALLDRYEERATGSGDFEAFIAFQDEVDGFTDRLPEDLPERDAFERADDRLQDRRLTESDFERVREWIDDAERTAAPLDAFEDATERYREARADCRRELDRVADRIDHLTDLRVLGEADLDAPTDELRDPIAAYDRDVADAFEAFRSDAPARDVLDLVATTRHFPLVPFRDPPEDLLAYLRRHEAGEETIPTLLEYADYSKSKLSHYVDDADALKRNVATQRTYLQRLDAEPLTVGWPPPAAAVLRWQCRERVSVVGRFAPDVVPALRTVRDLTRRDDYDRLRESARARSELTDEERERLRSGAVQRDLEAAREEQARLEDALDEHPSV